MTKINILPVSQYISRSEVASVLGKHPSTIARWEEADQTFPRNKRPKTLKSGHAYYLRSEIEEYIQRVSWWMASYIKLAKSSIRLSQ